MTLLPAVEISDADVYGNIDGTIHDEKYVVKVSAGNGYLATNVIDDDDFLIQNCSHFSKRLRALCFIGNFDSINRALAIVTYVNSEKSI